MVAYAKKQRKQPKPKPKNNSKTNFKYKCNNKPNVSVKHKESNNIKSQHIYNNNTEANTIDLIIDSNDPHTIDTLDTTTYNNHTLYLPSSSLSQISNTDINNTKIITHNYPNHTAHNKHIDNNNHIDNTNHNTNNTNHNTNHTNHNTKHTKHNTNHTKHNKHNTKLQKKRIPKTLRRDIWEKIHGPNLAKGKCYVKWCNRILDKMDFQAGHNIPESKGGTIAATNLFPICNECNQAMGDRYTIDEWSNMDFMSCVNDDFKNYMSVQEWNKITAFVRHVVTHYPHILD